MHLGYREPVIATLPWPRAALTATVITILGVTLHSLAGGFAPSLTMVLLVFIAATVVVRMAQATGGSTARNATLLVVGQLFVHLAMTPGTANHQGHGAMTGMSGADAIAGHAQHAAVLRRSGEAIGPQLFAWLSDAIACLAMHPTMIAAHLIAAVTVGAWLAHSARGTNRVLRLVSFAH